MDSQFLPHNESPANLTELRCELERLLPGSRFREELLRRAALTLAEARVLVEMLDQWEGGGSWKAGATVPDRSAFGVRPPHVREPI